MPDTHEQGYLIEKEQLKALLELINLADETVMEIYDSRSAIVEWKEDKTPLTQADMASHHILIEGLPKIFPGIPIISEESDENTNKETVQSDLFWLVDPIDGTKEFIARTDEFTICVSLIKNGAPVFGIISAPALGITYYGGQNTGSYKIEQGKKPVQLQVSKELLGIIVGSKSSHEPATVAYIAEHYSKSKLIQIGSQLKMALIAEAKADAFPRLDSPLHLWDLAAQHAVLEGAGGIVTRPDGSLIDYRDTTLMAGDFVGRSF